ncbi:translation initiation factor IF-2-like [Panicum virgatum]|uniref:translation initiation factor IF-2-like n=1 Tax=Panicum virgatum TaxID=38727 RepID=UPI0019D6015A|nr:translation initiation factor IF-2-like [Panicum virgatum]
MRMPFAEEQGAIRRRVVPCRRLVCFVRGRLASPAAELRRLQNRRASDATTERSARAPRKHHGTGRSRSADGWDGGGARSRPAGDARGAIGGAAVLVGRAASYPASASPRRRAPPSSPHASSVPDQLGGGRITQHLSRPSGNERPLEREEGSRAATHRPAAAPNDFARPRLPRDRLLAAAGEGSKHSTLATASAPGHGGKWKRSGHQRTTDGRKQGPARRRTTKSRGRWAGRRPLRGQGPRTCVYRKRRRQPHRGRVAPRHRPAPGHLLPRGKGEGRDRPATTPRRGGQGRSTGLDLQPTAASADIAAAAASWLLSSTDLLAGSSDPGPPATPAPWNLPRDPAALEHTDAGPDRWVPEFWIDGKLEGADGEKEVRCGG